MEIKKTNIILLLENIDYDGGVERVVCNMANSFIKNENNEVTIMSIFKNKNSPQYNIDKRIKIDSLNLSDSAQSYINNFMIKSSLLIRLKLNKDIADKLYQKLNKDIKYYILCNSYLFSPLYRSKNTKLIGIDHSRFPYNLKENKFIHYVRTLNVRQMDIITTLNNDELEKWKSFGKPTFVMPNFIPQNMIPNSNQYIHKEKTILSMGRMNTNQKGFDRLIDAYALIAKKYPEWTLKIFGSGYLQKEYKQKVKELDLENNIIISDFTKDPIIEYQKSSIYAMCSREEGFSMVLIEAGVYGNPLVSYDIEFGPKTIIKNEETGYIIPNNNKVAFAEALEKLMTNETLRTSMSIAVSEDIKNRFSEKTIISKWEKIIKSI